MINKLDYWRGLGLGTLYKLDYWRGLELGTHKKQTRLLEVSRAGDTDVEQGRQLEDLELGII